MTIADTINLAFAALARFRGELGRSLHPRTAGELRLVDEQLALARTANWSNIFVLPLAAVLTSLVHLQWVPLWRIVAWPLAVTIVCAGCELSYRRLLKLSDRSAGDIVRRARVHAGNTLVQTAAWCAIVIVLWVPGNVENHALLLLFVACSVAGWSSTGAFHLVSAAAGMIVYLIALLVLPLMEGSAGALEAGVCAIFWLLLRTLLVSNYRTRERMLRLEYERGDLVDNLKAAKFESDAARERSETASRAKSEFLANMSHELRTPLNAILGFSEIINTKAMGPVISDQYSEYAGYIHVSGQHLLSLINDILDLAKIEAGRMVLRETDVDLRRLLDDMVKMIGTKAQADGIVLAVDIDTSFPNVRGDERALRQIIVNLTSNAIKFTPAGGRVTAFANLLADGSLAFGVDDTGIGIAAEDHEKVFENFGQGRHDATLADKGTGLGLPIVRGLAEAHDGRVMLNSVPDHGTRVTVILPKERARERMRAAS